MPLMPENEILKKLYMCIHTHMHTHSHIHEIHYIFEQLPYVLRHIETPLKKSDPLKSPFKGMYKRPAICHVLEHQSFFKVNYFYYYPQILSI